MSECLRLLALKFTYKNFNYKCTVRRNLNAYFLFDSFCPIFHFDRINVTKISPKINRTYEENNQKII